MRLLLLASAGGALGAGARHLVTIGCAGWFGAGFPWATPIVNVAGSLAMGVVVAVVARHFANSPELRTFLATGILGGFTTFSAFSLDAYALAERGAIGQAAVYVAASVILSIAGLWAGLALAGGKL